VSAPGALYAAYAPEQNVELSLDLAERVYVLEKGSIRVSGPSARLRADESLRHEPLAL
jgi:ABC-type branched-subunit amino acid transport system ATPase component